MRISIIVAVADHGVIGRGNELPWRLSADLQRFRSLTMDHHLIVGRRTWDSIGRPLPGRRMIVISHSAPELPPDVELAGSLEAALDIARRRSENEAFVAGGSTIYELALDLADRLYLTRVHSEVEGDVFLPAIDFAQWTLASSEEGIVDARNPLPHTFETYERERAGDVGDA